MEILQFLLEEADKLSFSTFMILVLKGCVVYLIWTFVTSLINKLVEEIVPVSYSTIKKWFLWTISLPKKFILWIKSKF